MRVGEFCSLCHYIDMQVSTLVSIVKFYGNLAFLLEKAGNKMGVVSDNIFIHFSYYITQKYVTYL